MLKRLAEAAGATTASIKERRKEVGGMRVATIKQYLPALLLYVQRRLEGGRDAVISVRTRDACGVAVYILMMRLVEEGLAKRHKQGVYLIERGL